MHPKRVLDCSYLITKQTMQAPLDLIIIGIKFLCFNPAPRFKIALILDVSTKQFREKVLVKAHALGVSPLSHAPKRIYFHRNKKAIPSYFVGAYHF